MTTILLAAFTYLAFAVAAVLLSQKLGLGSVLGYLMAGIMIGPMLGLVGKETESIQHIAEFGVVMMLFLVGLELAPKMLWQLRHKLLGLGGLQALLMRWVIHGRLASLSAVFWPCRPPPSCCKHSTKNNYCPRRAARRVLPFCCFKTLPPFPCWPCCLCWLHRPMPKMRPPAMPVSTCLSISPVGWWRWSALPPLP